MCIREDITEPTRNIEDVLECHQTTLMAVGLASDLELDRTDTSNRNLFLTRYCEDIAVEGSESLEPGLVNSDVDVGSR